MNKPITEWLAFDDEKRRFVFNHIEDGHVPRSQELPTAVSDNQRKAWAKKLWIRRHSHLINGEVKP